MSREASGERDASEVHRSRVAGRAGPAGQLGGDFVTVNLDVLEDVPREKITVLDGRDETWTVIGTGPMLG